MLVKVFNVKVKFPCNNTFFVFAGVFVLLHLFSKRVLCGGVMRINQDPTVLLVLVCLSSAVRCPCCLLS